MIVVHGWAAVSYFWSSYSLVRNVTQINHVTPKSDYTKLIEQINTRVNAKPSDLNNSDYPKLISLNNMKKKIKSYNNLYVFFATMLSLHVFNVWRTPHIVIIKYCNVKISKLT